MGTVIMLAICAVAGYVLVGFVIERFFKAPPAADPESEMDELYASSLGVSRGASMLELERALARAIESHAPQNVAHMKEADQALAAIRLQSAQRAFGYLSARVR